MIAAHPPLHASRLSVRQEPRLAHGPVQGGVGLREGVYGTFSRSSMEGLQGEAAEQIVGAATK